MRDYFEKYIFVYGITSKINKHCNNSKNTTLLTEIVDV